MKPQFRTRADHILTLAALSLLGLLLAFGAVCAVVGAWAITGWILGA